MYTDSHVHLYDTQFDVDRDEVIKRAINDGVHRFIVPGIDVATSRKAIELSEQYDEIFAAVGIHPHAASDEQPGDFAELEKLSRHPKVVAIGEIGLDYHYDFSPPETQKYLFRRNIALARKRNLPLIIHNRKAVGDTIEILREEVSADPAWRAQKPTPHSVKSVPRGVFHCFDGSLEEAREVFDLNMLISYPGIVTFKNAAAAKIASTLSIEFFLLETDAPYMTPVPHRGKRNEPAYIKYIAGKFAELQHLSAEDIARTTDYNIFRLFGIGELGPPKVAYKLNNSLYLNITRRCDADCVFCDRKGEAVVKGHNLRIETEPTVPEIIEAIGDPLKYDEIVFCGYGEPTIRFDEVKLVAKWVKELGGKVRLNTDGHGDVINKRNIAPELKGLFDMVSISLNSIDPEQYGEMMRVDGKRFHKAMVEFAREARQYVPDVVMTVVDIESVDVEGARRYVEDVVGVKFKIRPYF
jgi:TatD DNase family protein